MTNDSRPQTEKSVTAAGSGSWQSRLSHADPTLRVHLVGMGGSGLSAIARVLLELGVQVSGSDRQANAATRLLVQAGALFSAGQTAKNLTQLPAAQRPDVVLISSAVDSANPERRAAEALGLPVVKRSEFLPALLARRTVIAVAGTHGKSTTTAMIVKTLAEAGIDAGYIIGATLPGYGSGSAGQAPIFVIEADEYDHMFLGLTPMVAVITNVEWDHPDCYPTAASFRRAFMEFVDRVPRHGLVITCADDSGAEQVRAYSHSRGPNWITYGVDERADLVAAHTVATPGRGFSADLLWQQTPIGVLALQAPGLHNVRNALAAVAVARWCRIPMEQALQSLSSYGGTDRRFELKGEAYGVLVFDDYAHHPTEIVATLAAARQRYPEQRIWAIFQPHTFSRTQLMLKAMSESFSDADEVIVTDIYAAREVDDGTVSAADLVAASPHPSIRHIAQLAAVADFLAQAVRPGDVVLTLGAGDGNKVGEMLLETLRQRNAVSGLDHADPTIEDK